MSGRAVQAGTLNAEFLTLYAEVQNFGGRST